MRRAPLEERQDAMDAPVVAALVTGVTSLIVAVFSWYVGRRNKREQDADARVQAKELADLNARLETERLRVNAQLDEAKAETDARREYAYTARLRLYSECEPLLFEASELAERARRRIASLARSCHDGDVKQDGSGWLEAEGYYFQSTTFYLLAPISTYRILQRRLTTFDLSLDPSIRARYELNKLLFRSFTDDFDLASRDPKLSYDPNRADPEHDDWRMKITEHPAVYRRQGFYLGRLEILADRLIALDARPQRPKTFGEFLDELEQGKRTIHDELPEVSALMKSFHPSTCPVFWRVLVYQSLIYDALIKIQESPDPDTWEVALNVHDENAHESLGDMDWRTKDEITSSAGVILDSAAAAANLWRVRAQEVLKRIAV